MKDPSSIHKMYDDGKGDYSRLLCECIFLFLNKDPSKRLTVKEFLNNPEVMKIRRRLNLYEDGGKERKGVFQNLDIKYIYNIKRKKKKNVVDHDSGNTDNTKEEEKKKEDERDGFIKREFGNDGHEWREWGDRCNIEEYCSNKECVYYEDLVDFCVGYGRFDIFDVKKYRCPYCSCVLNCISIIYCNCRYREKFTTKEGVRGITSWKQRRKGYDLHFIVGGSIKYKELLIDARPLCNLCY